MIRRRNVLELLTVAAVPLALLRCAPKPKPPPVLTLVMTGAADQNPDISGKPAPVAVRADSNEASSRMKSESSIFNSVVSTSAWNTSSNG